MSKNPTIIHIYPDSGGIFYYSEVIDRIYGAKNYSVIRLLSTNDKTINVNNLPKIDNVIYHIELGVDNVDLFWLSYRLAKDAKKKVIVTIHDPRKIVYNLSRINIPRHAGKIRVVIAKAVRKTLNTLIRAYVMPRWQNSGITKIFLNKIDATGDSYLPHPTYLKDPIERKLTRKPDVIKVGFTGYWGPWKGIDELIDACIQVNTANNIKLELVIAGAAPNPHDSYSEHVYARSRKLNFVKLPGFIADIKYTEFLEGLDVLVIPYYLKIPGGVSATAQRSLEMGLPIIASKTPALYEQIGRGNAIFVSPESSSSLAEGIIEYANNYDTYNARSIIKQKDIYKHNSWGSVGDRLASIVEEVTKK